MANSRVVRCEVEYDAQFKHATSANGFDYFALVFKGEETGDYVQVRIPNDNSQVNSAFLRNEIVTKLPAEDT